MRGKMTHAIEALVLFLLSLPSDCKFNVCSIGSKLKFIFEEARSVPYNPANAGHAIAEVKKFKADFGGLDIYTPLRTVLEMETDCKKTDIFLLTDGAVENANDIIALVEEECNLDRRVHTLGLGEGVDEKLIKKCAAKGFGNYYLIKDYANLEYKVIDALTQTQLNYLVLQNLVFLDANNAKIQLNWLKDCIVPLKNA